MPVGKKLDVTAHVELGKLTPDDVRVQLYVGVIDSKGMIQDAQAYDLEPKGHKGSVYTFEGTLSFDRSGDQGVSVRVLPKNDNLSDPFMTGYLRWAHET